MERDSVTSSTEGQEMRRRHTCLMTTVMVTMGLLVLGQTATATDQLLGAMGMAKLPGKAAPNFTLLDVSGKQVSLQEYRGKAVFLNFWATWCIPCREEMPAMEQLHQLFQGQGLAILAVNLKESAEQVRRFSTSTVFPSRRYSTTAGPSLEPIASWGCQRPI